MKYVIAWEVRESNSEETQARSLRGLRKVVTGGGQ